MLDRRLRTRRARATILLLLAAVAGAVIALAVDRDEGSAPQRLILTEFSLSGLGDAGALDRARGERRFHASIPQNCSTFMRFELHQTARAITVQARSRWHLLPPGISCAGSSDDFSSANLNLPDAVGDRALILYRGPHTVRLYRDPPDKQTRRSRSGAPDPSGLLAAPTSCRLRRSCV